jgi:tetratricopeptide (TPR) repeat protein
MRARDAEQSGANFAALWHLDRLIADFEADGNTAPETQTNRWLAYARRAHIWLAEGKQDRAEADDARAQELSTPAPLACWYRHRIMYCLMAGQHQTALWYLNRAVAVAPKVWQLYAERAAILGQLHKSEEKAADVTRAIELGADSQFLVRVANEHAGQKQWEQAARAFSLARQRGPCPIEAHWQEALTCLKRGNRKGYLEVCTRLLQEERPLWAFPITYQTIWVCTLGPEVLNDYSPLVPLAEKLLSQANPEVKPATLTLLGALLYRAGRFQEAIDRLQEGVQAGKGKANPLALLFLAMAQHRMGKPAEARKLLAQVPPPAQPEGGGSPWQMLELEVLRQEATALVPEQ